MTNTEYLDDQDAEEPDDFIISLTAQVSFYLSLYVVFKRFLVVCGGWGEVFVIPPTHINSTLNVLSREYRFDQRYGLSSACTTWGRPHLRIWFYVHALTSIPVGPLLHTINWARDG
jgi:hypothetical protein